MRTWPVPDCTENTREYKSIVLLSLSSAAGSEQKPGSKHSVIERHIRVETLPSMQHVKALHSRDLTPYNKKHLHEAEKTGDRQRGWAGRQAGVQAGEDGKHHNKSINQWHRWSPALVINPRKTLQPFSVDYTNKRPAAKKHIVVLHPVFELAAIWNVLLQRGWRERRLTIKWCYGVDFQVCSPELTSLHRRSLLPRPPQVPAHSSSTLVFIPLISSLLRSCAKDVMTETINGPEAACLQPWRCESEEMGFTGMNSARRVRLRMQSNKMWGIFFFFFFRFWYFNCQCVGTIVINSMGVCASLNRSNISYTEAPQIQHRCHSAFIRVSPLQSLHIIDVETAWTHVCPAGFRARQMWVWLISLALSLPFTHTHVHTVFLPDPDVLCRAAAHRFWQNRTHSSLTLLLNQKHTSYKQGGVGGGGGGGGHTHIHTTHITQTHTVTHCHLALR